MDYGLDYIIQSIIKWQMSHNSKGMEQGVRTMDYGRWTRLHDTIDYRVVESYTMG